MTSSAENLVYDNSGRIVAADGQLRAVGHVRADGGKADVLVHGIAVDGLRAAADLDAVPVYPLPDGDVLGRFAGKFQTDHAVFRVLFPCQRRFLADKVLVGGDGPAEAAFIRAQVLEVLLEREALFHRDGADVDLERLQLPASDGFDGFQRQIVNFCALVECGIDFIAVFTGEAGAMDVDGNAAELALADAEALEIVDRRVQHGVHRLEAVRALYGVHIPIVGDDLRVNVRLAPQRIPTISGSDTPVA